ncbi:hypothetical protein [Nocardia asteroides]|uniref:hypothetical protein n=1 Tax=Nocardia asteroides TaxID=1824 RepID=UPI001E649012|nr:hypothetical protein [Nocardia asteroides]UGT58933.1 hypothetical protein LTT85_33135 [Nocardia asteroides]
MSTAPPPDHPSRRVGGAAFADRAAATARLDVIVLDLRAEEFTRDDLAAAFIRAQIPRVDTDLLPADLADRITRRETDPSLRDHHKRAVPVAWTLPAAVLTALGTAALVILAVAVQHTVATAGLSVDFAAHGDELGRGELALLLGGPTALAAAAALRRAGARRHPLALTGDEVAQADRAAVCWPRTHGDGAWWSRRLDATQRDTARHDLFGATATTRWPEARVVAAANLLATAIRTSPAYRHDDLDPLRLDLDRLVRDISLRAHRIWQLRTRTSTPASPSPAVADTLRERHALETEAGDAAWITLIGLLDTMAAYRKELARIEGILTDIAALERVAAHDMDSTVAQLLRDAAGNELDVDHLTRVTEQLTHLRAGLDTRLTVLRALFDNSTMPVHAADLAVRPGARP